MVAQSPSAPASPLPVFPAAPLPIYFLGAAVSDPCLVRCDDKKKADPKTSLKVFRRGCLKGRVFFIQIPFLRKCEEPRYDCMKRNHPWKIAIFPGPAGFLREAISRNHTQKSVSERNGQWFFGIMPNEIFLRSRCQSGLPFSSRSTSRRPTWLGGPTSPCSSICSIRRAALL